ncbi:MAG: hypothetical protein AAFY76_12585 [Cyanobacteria bacterium J06649_11]
MDSKRKEISHNWTAYLAALSTTVGYFLGKEFTADASFLPYGILFTLLIAVPPMVLHFFIIKGKTEAYKRNSMIAISFTLLLGMIFIVT